MKIAFIGLATLATILATGSIEASPPLASSSEVSATVDQAVVATRYHFKTFLTHNLDNTKAFEEEIEKWLQDNPNIEIVSHEDSPVAYTVEQNGQKLPVTIRIVSIVYKTKPAIVSP